MESESRGDEINESATVHHDLDEEEVVMKQDEEPEQAGNTLKGETITELGAKEVDKSELDTITKTDLTEVQPKELDKDNETDLSTGSKDKDVTIEVNGAFEFTLDDDSFFAHPLIEHIPEEIQYTCFDAYEQNLYLGSKEGDLLHYFEIEKNNYMLVSQTKFSADFQLPIDRMILLPKIERALLLSNSIVTQFLLPEFAPAPNMPSTSNVLDINLKSYSKKSNTYRVLLFLENSIDEYRVTQDSFVFIKKYAFKSIKKACLQQSQIMTDKLNNYELIDLEKKESLPLFKVSESDVPLKPVMACHDGNKFLLASGGISIDSTAMIFQVTQRGEMSNGTIVLDRYPDNIISRQPYIIVSFDNNELQIFKELPSGESIIIQRIISKSNYNVTETYKDFECSNMEEAKSVKDQIIEKLCLVPLEKANETFIVEGEKSYVGDIFKLSTSLTMYGKEGIYLLIQKPTLLKFDKYDEVEIEKIRKVIKNYKNISSKYEGVERQYLLILKVLLQTLHSNSIDEKLISKWYQYFHLIDTRILLYLLDLDYHGSIWVFNGLKPFIQNLKTLKLIHKVKDIKVLLILLNQKLTHYSQKDEIRDYTNVVMSVELNLFRLLSENNDDIDLNMFIDPVLEEILKICEAKPEEYSNLLKKIYQGKKRYLDLISVLKKENNSQLLLNTISSSFDELPEEYKANSLLEDLVLIITSLPLNKDIIKCVIDVITKAHIPVDNFTDKLTPTIDIKVAIIEYLGAKSFKDKEFLIKFYLANLQKEIELHSLWDKFGEYTAEYTQDLDYFKTNLSDFLFIKFKSDDAFTKFSTFLEQIKDICRENKSDKTDIRIALEEIKKIDISNILLFLFIEPDYEDIISLFVTSQELFESYLSHNNFLNIELLLTKENFLSILKHYLNLADGPEVNKVVITFLKRNRYIIDENDLLYDLFKILPRNYTISSLFAILFPIIKKMDSQQEDSILMKSLIKNELSSYSKMLSNFEEDD